MTESSLTNLSAIEWLALGRAHLNAGENNAAAKALGHALKDPVTRLPAHNLIESHALEGSFHKMLGPNCEISPADDIFRFFEGHPSSVNPLRDYLTDGCRTLAELMQLLEVVDKPLMKASSFLEFASGHGRFTRHLVKALGTERVTVSDVVPDAVDFSKETFSVAGFLSSSIPENVIWGRTYDIVFVLSLFSHLPKHTWTRWLNCLYAGVAPGGVLVFSTHGSEAAQRQNVTLDADGFFFAPSSESLAIDAQEYGTTFTSEEFVRESIDESIGIDHLIHMKSVHFWNHQDAYVVRRT